MGVVSHTSPPASSKIYAHGINVRVIRIAQEPELTFSLSVRLAKTKSTSNVFIFICRGIAVSAKQHNDGRGSERPCPKAFGTFIMREMSRVRTAYTLAYLALQCAEGRVEPYSSVSLAVAKSG